MGFLYHEMIQYNGDPTNNLGILIVGKKNLGFQQTKSGKHMGFQEQKTEKTSEKNQGSMY